MELVGSLDLTDVEARVVGSLIEKSMTTPDNYPLSTNALVAACNQKSSRSPVLSLAESEVDAALLSLRERGMARSLRPTGSRAWKHRHVLHEALPFDDSELALIAVLLLRGAQAPGELKTRTERLHHFADVAEVEMCLASLADREEALVRNLGRGSGQSQDRWVQLLTEATPENLSDAPAVPQTRRRVSSAQPQRVEQFRLLHESGMFVMPNPWDRGSARILAEAGFPALATSSAGHGRSIGKDDQEVTRDEMVEHVADLAEILTVPLNADSERLYPTDDGGIGRTVALLAEAGAAGCSIEDYDPATGTIDPIDVAGAAVAEAARACAAHGVVLTARAENHLYGITDLDDTIARLRRYSAAGAEVLYAPGLTTPADIFRVVEEVGEPVNILALPGAPPIIELRELGVRRVSLGSVLFNSAYSTLRNDAADLSSQ